MNKKLFPIIFYLSFFLITTFGILKYFNAMRVDPDHLLWHAMGSSLRSNLIPSEFFDEHLNYLKGVQTTEETIYVAKVRQEKDGGHNYIGGSVFISLSGWFTENILKFSPFHEYNRFATSSFIMGFSLPVIIIFVLIGFFVGRDKDLDVKVALLIMLIFTLVSDIKSSHYVARFLSYSLVEKGTFSVIQEMFGFLINPSSSFSIFSFTIKCRLVCLTMLAFYFRWKNRLTISYFVLLCGGLFHLTYGGLIFIFVLALDVIRQPQVLKNWYIRGCLLVGVGLFILKDALAKQAFSVLSMWHLVCVAILAILLVILMVLLRGSQNRLLGHLNKLRDRLIVLGPIKTDLLLILFIWLATFILVIPISQSVSPLDNYYFWGQLHGRVLGLLQPSILLGICLLTVGKLKKKFGQDRLLQYSTIVVVVALLFFTKFAVKKLDNPCQVTKRIFGDFKEIELLSQKPLTELPGKDEWISNEVFGYNPKTQNVIYYTFGKSLNINKPLYKAIFK